MRPRAFAIATLLAASTACTCGDARPERARTPEPVGVDGQDSNEARSRAACTQAPAACAELAEAAAASEMEAVRDNPPALLRFLNAMPKGADLHNHLPGAVHAEEYLAWATERRWCIHTSDRTPMLLTPSCDDEEAVPLPLARDPLYGRIVRAWSMLDFDPSSRRSRRVHFFSAFRKFGAISRIEHARMLAAVRRRAAEENLFYLEPMLTKSSAAHALGNEVWEAHHAGEMSEADFATFHRELLAAPGFDHARSRYVEDARETRDGSERELRCNSDTPSPGCDVSVRFLANISRNGPLPGTFAQLVAAYEAAREEPLLVGLNLMGREDLANVRHRYDDQNAMLRYLHEHYSIGGISPIRVSLHAGEVTPESVPSTYALDEENHIREAVVAGADRIGHGVDLLDESDPEGLLTLLRERGVLVEICLTTNDIILGVRGDAHPLRTYVEAGVPIALATDDPGVTRSNLTSEFARAVTEHAMTYPQLTDLARASLEHSFLSGNSLFSDPSSATLVEPCAPPPGETLASAPPSEACAAFLAANDRARLQYEHERRRLAFEASIAR